MREINGCILGGGHKFLEKVGNHSDHLDLPLTPPEGEAERSSMVDRPTSLSRRQRRPASRSGGEILSRHRDFVFQVNLG